MLRKINNFLATQFGIDVFRFARALLALPRFLFDLKKIKKDCRQLIVIKPCLHDKFEEGGSARGEYFWQDLYIARKIFQANPERHVDIGSRIDGFVAHVASYREIEVIDIRPIQSVVPGVTFRRIDMMSDDLQLQNYCDSVSCLHALEHFGLGRYGDPLDVDGHIKGLRNLARLLKAGGCLYLSVPVGIARIEFNANRILCPEQLLHMSSSMGLRLDGLGWLLPGGALVESHEPRKDILSLKKMSYALGIFIFTKQAQSISLDE
jgi:SAM-dependent methyltransferase